MTDTSAKDVLTLMMEFELAVGRLYRLFAEQFKEVSDFWEALANEERSHAAHLHTLIELVRSGAVPPPEAHFDRGLIEVVLAKVRRIAEDFKRNPFDLEKAAATARALEENVIEAQFFKVFDGDTLELKRVFKILHEESAGHGARVREFQRTYQWS